MTLKTRQRLLFTVVILILTAISLGLSPASQADTNRGKTFSTTVRIPLAWDRVVHPSAHLDGPSTYKPPPPVVDLVITFGAGASSNYDFYDGWADTSAYLDVIPSTECGHVSANITSTVDLEADYFEAIPAPPFLWPKNPSNGDTNSGWNACGKVPVSTSLTGLGPSTEVDFTSVSTATASGITWQDDRGNSAFLGTQTLAGSCKVYDDGFNGKVIGWCNLLNTQPGLPHP